MNSLEGRITVKQCTVCVEDLGVYDTDFEDFASRSAAVSRIRIAKSVGKNVTSESWFADHEETYYGGEQLFRLPLPNSYHELATSDFLTRDEIDYLTYTIQENDDIGEDQSASWPFRGVKWAVRFGEALKYYKKHGEIGPLWGNQASFSIYWYKHAVLLWTKTPSGKRLPFAQDFMRGDCG